jgi:undecaprenyl-diphosphatase
MDQLPILILTAYCLAGLGQYPSVLGRPAAIRSGWGRFLFLLGLTIALTAATVPFDRIIRDTVRSLPADIWKPFFWFWTRIADGLVLYPLLVLAAWLCSSLGSKALARIPLLSLIAGLSTGVSVQILKHLFLRARPRTGGNPWSWFHFDRFVSSWSGNPNYISMPSGHTAVMFAVCTVLSSAVRNKVLKFLVFLPAILTAVSRVYLNRHWPSDTIAAAGLGIIAGGLFILWFPARDTSRT